MAEGGVEGNGASDEMRHRDQEQKFWRVQTILGSLSLVVTALAMTGAFVSACLAWNALLDSHKATRASQEAAKASQEAAEEARRQANIAEKQTEILKDGLIAAIRSSTTGRAWLSLKYSGASTTPDQSGLSRILTITYEVRNAGDTPASITAVQGRLFVALSREAGASLDPVAPDTSRFLEVQLGQAQTAQGLSVAEANVSRRPVVAEGKEVIGPISQSVTLSVPHFGAGYSFPPDAPMYLHLVVRYRDVFNFARVTSFLGQVTSGSAGPSLHNEYNCWDDGCPAKLRPPP